MQKLIYITLLLLCCQPQCRAQSMEDMDARMAYYLGRLSYWYLHADEEMGGADSLENNNDLFIEYLERTVIRHDSCLTAPFPLAVKEGLNISTSADQRMRIFAWDRKDDPDRQHIENIAAYMTYYDIRYTDMATFEKRNTPCYFYDAIIPVKTTEGTVFLALYHRTLPRRIEGIRAYGIVEHKLAKIPIFKDRTGTYSELTYYYALDDDDGKDKILLHFNDAHDKLYIPEIRDGYFKGDFMVYVLNEHNFEYDKHAR